MSNSINIGDFEKAINDKLDIYCEELTNKLKKVTDDVMDDLVKNTKKDANKDTGKYQKAIKSKTTFENTRSKINTWYVSGPHYRLSHLLESGHKIKNGKSSKVYGKTKAYKFISKNEEIAVKQFNKKVEEVIRNEH